MNNRLGKKSGLFGDGEVFPLGEGILVGEPVSHGSVILPACRSSAERRRTAIATGFFAAGSRCNLQEHFQSR